MRIRVTTRADLFEERKRQHIERGYRVEEERSTPINRSRQAKSWRPRAHFGCWTKPSSEIVTSLGSSRLSETIIGRRYQGAMRSLGRHVYLTNKCNVVVSP